MDISVYINELLFEHDCVIIPGFGGFICNYRPALINEQQQTIAPPARVVSFNRSLQTNDGLLANYIAGRNGYSFELATVLISGWANATQSLLISGDEVNLPGIGLLNTNREGRVQFTPDVSANFLKEAFALPVVSALPVVKGKQASLHTAASRRWKIAAMAAVLVIMAGLATLMGLGIEIKPLRMNQAGMFSLINGIFKTREIEIQPLATTAETIPAGSMDNKEVFADSSNNEPLTATVEQPASAETTTQYYIIIGAFRNAENVEAAKKQIAVKFAGMEAYTEFDGRLTKVGYAAGNNAAEAHQRLTEARTENSAYWLLKK